MYCVDSSMQDATGSPSDASMSDGGLVAYSDQGEKVYLFVGVIDVLQNYGRMKKLEHNYKAMVYNGDEVSVHRPDFYRQRFQEFMSTRVFEADPSLGPAGNESRTSSSRSQRTRLRRRIATNPGDEEEEGRAAEVRSDTVVKFAQVIRRDIAWITCP